MVSANRNAPKVLAPALIVAGALGLQGAALWWFAERFASPTSLWPGYLVILGTSVALVLAGVMGYRHYQAARHQPAAHAATGPLSQFFPDAVAPNATDVYLTQAQMQEQIAAAQQEVQATRQLLESILNTLDVGLEIWDDQDRLMFYNEKVTRLRKDFHNPQEIGQKYDVLLMTQLRNGLIPEAIGREDEWLRERIAVRGNHVEPLLQHFSGDQWVHTYETRTPEGYMVTTRVDVSNLIQKGLQLEAQNTELTRSTCIDELTGLANRRAFESALKTEWSRAARSNAPLSVLMVDIDHFKRYNDHYGHLGGDECLKRVAKVLAYCVRRAGEVVARYGGEEFIIILPGAELNHARDTAQRCLDFIEREHIAHAASPSANLVSVSIGVATIMPQTKLDPASIINAADVALYRAKANGRCRYEVATPTDWAIDKDTPRTQFDSLV